MNRRAFLFGSVATIAGAVAPAASASAPVLAPYGRSPAMEAIEGIPTARELNRLLREWMWLLEETDALLLEEQPDLAG